MVACACGACGGCAALWYVRVEVLVFIITSSLAQICTHLFSVFILRTVLCNGPLHEGQVVRVFSCSCKCEWQNNLPQAVCSVPESVLMDIAAG